MFGRFYAKVNAAFSAAEDTKLIADRKAALIQGSDIGLFPKITYLVYPKAHIKEIERGQLSIVHGWIVDETVADPKNKYDGLVICRPRT